MQKNIFNIFWHQSGVGIWLCFVDLSNMMTSQYVLPHSPPPPSLKLFEINLKPLELGAWSLKTLLVRNVLVNFSIFCQLFHIFECFVPWKLIIFNLTLSFELNYLYSSLKSLLPKTYFNIPKQEKWRFPKNYDIILKPGGKFGMKSKTSHKKLFSCKVSNPS